MKYEIVLKRECEWTLFKYEGSTLKYRIPGWLLNQNDDLWLTARNIEPRLRKGLSHIDITNYKSYSQYYYDRVVMNWTVPSQRPKYDCIDCEYSNKEVDFITISRGYGHLGWKQRDRKHAFCSNSCASKYRELYYYEYDNYSKIVKSGGGWGIQHKNSNKYKAVADWRKQGGGFGWMWRNIDSLPDVKSRLDEVHQEFGLVIKNMWNDPNSVFNSIEFRKGLSSRMTAKWEDPNSSYNSLGHRRILSDNVKFIWSHPELYPHFHQVMRNFYKSGGAFKVMWNHPDEYPYFHEAQRIWAENGGLFGYLQRHPEITTCRGGLYNQGYYQSIKGGYCRYMSSYELKLIKDLDNDPEVLSFITQPLGIKYYRPGDEKSHRYYPDFLVTFVDGHKLLIEVKPEIFLDTELNQLKFAIGEKYANDHGWDWAVFTEAELGI